MSKDIHILMAAPGKGTGKGGVVRQAQYLVGEAAKHDDGMRFSWLSTHSANKLWPIYFMGTLLRFLWLALTDKPDTIHLNIASKGSFYRKWILFRFAQFFNIKHIAHLHGGGFSDFYENGSTATKRRIEHLFTTASSVIVLGKIWKAFAEKIGVSEANIHLIPNAVPTPREASKGGGDIPHIIFVGHLLPRKGVGELIDALAALKDIPWRATLAGSGEMERYQEQVKSTGLTDRVTFAGWLGDSALTQLYQESDILVLPSHIENQPLTILEAMAHGLAIICTNVGTVKEIVNEDTAIIIESSEIAPPLKDALITFLENLEKRQKTAHLARTKHLEFLTLARYYSDYCTGLFKLRV
ncbi:MAG: glycosyltransferase family 4 protein [Rickettsiales bacterium]|nr:glycosyltransferase family 4 protein [Rickettsiales bacterium]